MKKEFVTLTVLWLAGTFCGSCIASKLPDELETIGQVIQLCDNVDSRGVPDPPRKNNKFQERRSCRMPDMIALSDTEWLVLYDEYDTPHSTGNWSRIVIQRTIDAGKSWSTQVINEQKKTIRIFWGIGICHVSACCQTVRL